MKSVVWFDPVSGHCHFYATNEPKVRQSYIDKGWVEFLPPCVERAPSALVDAARNVMRIWDSPQPTNYKRAEKAFTDLRVATMWAALKETS
mgnify:CR=1 FL=1